MAEALSVKEFDEIVFEHRNKAYGAYELRKRYARNMNIAFLIAMGVFVMGVSLPVILNYLNNLTIENVRMQEVDLNMDPPPLDKDEPPPPPPPPDPPPPIQETIKFTPPVIVEEVKEEDIPPITEEVEKTKVDVQTVAGTGEVEDLETEGTGPAEIETGPGEIFTVVEQNPEFPGGDAKLFEYLGKNIKYPAMARENGITGTVYVTFVVESSGEISDVKLLRGIKGGCDEEAMRVVKNMPSWKPGRQNGKNVRVQFNLPVRFKLL